MYYLEKIKKKVAEAISTQTGIKVENILVESPNQNFDCDLVVATFGLARELKQNPVAIAEVLIKNVSGLEFVSKAIAVNGYVNIYLNYQALALNIQADFEANKDYGYRTMEHPETAIVDYCGFTYAKPLSVGHFRPAIQGQVLINLLKTQGYEVVGDVHQGDWGLPFGMLIYKLENGGDITRVEAEGVYYLNQLYIEFNNQLKDSTPEEAEALRQEARNNVVRMTNDEPLAMALFNLMVQVSEGYIKQILERISVEPDTWVGEYLLESKAQRLVKQLIEEHQTIQNDDGSVIIDLESAGIKTPILLRKRDGSMLYASTDMAAIEYRINKYNPSKIIYCVDIAQEFHFAQVFAAAKIVGLTTPYNQLIFSGHGQLKTKDETGKVSKMSSRKGVIYLEQLLDETHNKALEMLKSDIQSKEATAEIIAQAAIKFADLAQNKNTTVIFDWEKMLSLHGYSGPYLQYSVVRANAILDKANFDLATAKPNFDKVTEHEEILLLAIAGYPEILTRATELIAPHILVEYLYEMAKDFSVYYDRVPVLGDPDPESRVLKLWLIARYQQVMIAGLSLMTIGIPERM